LALVVPLALVLLAVLILARSTAASPVPYGSAPPASHTSAAAGSPDGSAAPPRPTGPAAPELQGGGAWINSQPLSLAGMEGEGKVVLIDFWTYGCYNCQNTLPYVKQWWDKYKDQGLVIVGVHTPEFASEHVLENVQRAVERQGIGWPVVQDNDYAIWRAYGNRYWPRFYLVDHHGRIIYDHIGEGAYDETEQQIQAALAAAKTP
jgi:thiol-disulfide isomerase/thioredoxin